MDFIRSILFNRITWIVILLVALCFACVFGYRFFWPYKVSVEVFPQDSVVTIDGKKTDTKHNTIRAVRGTHSVSIKAPGYMDRTVPLIINDTIPSVSVALEPKDNKVDSYKNEIAQKILRNDDRQNNGLYKQLPFTITVNNNDISFTECTSVKYETKAICYESFHSYSIKDIQKIIVNYGNYAHTSIYDIYRIQNDSILIYEDSFSNVYFIDNKIYARTNQSRASIMHKLQDLHINVSKYGLNLLPKTIEDYGETE